MGSLPQNTGTLQPGVWKQVMQGWGKYDVLYSVVGTSLPVLVHKYTPLYREFTLPLGGTLEFDPLGYGEVWFKSDAGGSYAFEPL